MPERGQSDATGPGAEGESAHPPGGMGVSWVPPAGIPAQKRFAAPPFRPEKFPGKFSELKTDPPLFIS